MKTCISCHLHSFIFAFSFPYRIYSLNYFLLKWHMKIFWQEIHNLQLVSHKCIGKCKRFLKLLSYLLHTKLIILSSLYRLSFWKMLKRFLKIFTFWKKISDFKPTRLANIWIWLSFKAVALHEILHNFFKWNTIANERKEPINFPSQYLKILH